MKTKDETAFIQLPDWKKVHLKISYSKYTNYKLMTDEQERERKRKIFQIAAHYGNLEIEDLQSNPIFTLDHSWPRELEKYITPKLLDLFDGAWFTKFGHCYFCSYYYGHNSDHHKYFFARKSKAKIIPFSGKCKHPYNSIQRNDTWITGQQQQFVDPNSRCYLWNPLNLVSQMIQTDITNKLCSFDCDYDLDDYVIDLQNVKLWNYFFNKFENYS